MPHFFNLSKTEISCWLWMFSALCLCFLSLMFHLMWGNHDWLPLLIDSKISSGLIEGRFSQYLLLNIFLSGKILPIFNILFGFILYTLSLTLLCTKFFKFTPDKPLDKLFLITVATLPYIIEILYFHFITFSLLSWPLIITLSLLSAQKAQKKHFVCNTLLSALLLFIALGGYPAASGMYATATCLYLIKELSPQQPLKKLIQHISPFAISFTLAFLPLPFIYHWLKQHNLMIEIYNTEPETLLGLIEKIPSVIYISIKSLLQPQPFFPLSFKLLSAALIFYLISTILLHCYKQKNFITGTLLTTALLIAMKLPAWLVKETAESYYASHDPAAFMVRTDFYVIPCIVLFSFFFLKTNAPRWKNNLLFSLSAILLFLNINANLAFVKTYQLGFTAENLLLERIIERFQSHQDYQKNKIYNITQLGEFSARAKYYHPAQIEKYGYYTLTVPFTRYWLANEHFNFYPATPFAADQIAMNPQYITPEMINFINDKNAVWPSEKALYIYENIGIIALTSKGKAPFTEQFNQFSGTLK